MKYLQKKRSVFILLLVCLLLELFIGSSAHTLENKISVPLYVINRTETKDLTFPVGAGIPFPEGMVFPKDLSELAVFDDRGNLVPSQFDPFVLWWGKDRSIKWLRVDMMTTISQGAPTQYYLRNKKKDTIADTPLKFSESNEEIVIITGPLKAVISKQRGTILESVFIDSNNNKSFEKNERIIKPDSFNGVQIQSENQQIVQGKTSLYNMWGTGSGRIKNYKPKGKLVDHTYLSGLGKPDKIIIEKQGPVKVTILIEGKHFPQYKGKGVKSDGFYYYTIRLHFFAGKPYIQMEHSIDNNRQEYPIHIYRIKDLRLHFTLDDWAKKNSEYMFGGEKENISGKFKTDQVSILQDSASFDRWDLHSRIQNKSKDEKKKTPGYFFESEWRIGPSLFRGYKIIDDKVLKPESRILGSGDHAPGWAALSNQRQGVSAHLNRFWRECPKAIVLGKSFIEPVLFPDFSPEEFQIHSGTRKTHTLFFLFQKNDPSFLKTQNIAKLFRYSPLLKTDIDWYTKSRALPRLMGLVKNNKELKKAHWFPRFRYDKKIITARWNTLGLSSFHFNTGGMHGNYWSIFKNYLQTNNIISYEQGEIRSKWASEAIPWLINDYSFGPKQTEMQNRLIGYGEKELFTSEKSSKIKGWVNPYTTNIPGFSSPDKFHMDGEHLIHTWPFEWYYLTGSPIAKDGLMGVGNQAKYSTHRNFFKSRKNYGGNLKPAPSLEDINYFDDQNQPERIPWYFYTRIYSSHLLSTAMTYAATGDEASLFYAKWLVRRILYLQRQYGGVVGDKKRWKNIPPWQESETAIAAFELYKETGDEELLDVMGSWLEWVWKEAYVKGKGMPHRFKRGTEKEKIKKLEHHWYPGVAAPMCFVALGDQKALTLTKEWADSSLAYIKKGKFLNTAVGQSASYVLNYHEKKREDKIPPEKVTDLTATYKKSECVITLNWTAPLDKGTNSSGSAEKYWIKIADKPIVDHAKFPENLGKETGFYQADNMKEESLPKKAGSKEKIEISSIAPHGAYGSDKVIKISEFKKGIYYLVIKSWDGAGNISSLSNLAQVRIQ